MASRNVATGVALSLGLITASVSVQSAVEAKAKSGNVLLCDHGHDPTRIRQPYVCDSCTHEVPIAQLKKGRPDGDKVIVLEADELAAARADSDAFKKRAPVTAHPLEQVSVLTSTGEKLYYLTPERGHEAAYATLLALVSAHPELAFMTQWTPRTATSQYQVLVYGEVLCLQERTSGSTVRPAPEIPLEFNGDLVKLAEQVLAMPGFIAEYDPATYEDKTEEHIAALVASKTAVPMQSSAPAAPMATSADSLLEALRTQLEQAAPKPKRVRASRAKAKVSA